MGLTRAEQETVIRWDEDEQIVHVYSASPKTWRKLARLGISPTKETARGGKPSGRFYTVPMSIFRWGVKGKRGQGAGRGQSLRNLRNYRDQPKPDAGVEPAA